MIRRLAVLSTFAAAVAWTVPTEAALKVTDLPPAVQKAVADQTKGAVIKGVSKETENGKTVYEVETTVEGRGREVQNLATTRGARTMALDPKTHNIFLAAASYETPSPAPAPAAAASPGAAASGAPAAAAPARPVMVPGSFKVLVYGMSEAPKK